MPRYTVTNKILGPNGSVLADVKVDIKLMPSGGFLADLKHELVRNLSVITNVGGIWTANLESNLNILPTGSWYEVIEKVPQSAGGPRTWQIRVQNAGGNLSTLLV